MSKPCAHCPFRSDREFWLYPERREEIAHSLLHDGNFSCHETTAFDDEGVLVERHRERFCVGAALFVENVTGSMFANVCVRLSAMCGERDYKNIDRSIPVFTTLEEFLGDPS